MKEHSTGVRQTWAWGKKDEEGVAPLCSPSGSISTFQAADVQKRAGAALDTTDPQEPAEHLRPRPEWRCSQGQGRPGLEWKAAGYERAGEVIPSIPIPGAAG